MSRQKPDVAFFTFFSLVDDVMSAASCVTLVTWPVLLGQVRGRANSTLLKERRKEGRKGVKARMKGRRRAEEVRRGMRKVCTIGSLASQFEGSIGYSLNYCKFMVMRRSVEGRVFYMSSQITMHNDI